MSLLVADRLSLPRRLRETSLTLEGGTLTCLIGPNGSGKTSLLHALAGIGAPSGTVLVDAVEPLSLGPGRRQRLLSYLPASRDIHWPLSARDVIALGLSGKDDGAIDAILAALELEEMAERRIDRMSTGERSRVLIARSLVAMPRLLLLDEPAANLDPLWQLRMMELLRSLTRRNRQAALVAVHDLELARGYGDRLIVMRDCAIEADGEPGALFAGPVIPSVFGIRKSAGVWRPAD